MQVWVFIANPNDTRLSGIQYWETWYNLMETQLPACGFFAGLNCKKVDTLVALSLFFSYERKGTGKEDKLFRFFGGADLFLQEKGSQPAF